jgi:5-methylthioribose kinase
MLAHLILAAAASAETGIVQSASAAGDAALVGRFAGVEIMRRLIGVAQLPFPATLERKRELLALSRELVAGG